MAKFGGVGICLNTGRKGFSLQPSPPFSPCASVLLFDASELPYCECPQACLILRRAMGLLPPSRAMVPESRILAQRAFYFCCRLNQILTSEPFLLLNNFSGLFSFASTTFILSMYNVNARGIHAPNVVVGMAVFTGGLLQFMAGMWEFPRGNTFGATGNALNRHSTVLVFIAHHPFRSSFLVRRLLDVICHHPHPKLWNPRRVC